MIRRVLKSRIAKGQMELSLHRPVEPDRHFHKGGRSFYFFDFDDNIAFLSTPTYVFHKSTGEELALTSQEFAMNSMGIGKSGPLKDFRLDHDPVAGTFRNFRDKNISRLRKIFGERQNFVRDLSEALGHPDLNWKGPSWNCFFHAVHNQRPLSLITARGHHPETMKEGIRLLYERGFLSKLPNYLSIYPVSHPVALEDLGGTSLYGNIPLLKRHALRKSVEKAIEVYGYSPYHRFGMSDDDPKNIQWIHEEMVKLKQDYPQMSFFVIETHSDHFEKREVRYDGFEKKQNIPFQQLSLF
ncbi:MAG TPA: hypothetical protein DCL41_03200 [Bdellovibrionales bacterium]|nr:hypothetical protein [Pseudobdellovibrionaceae bacterium]HAG90848.1 hypothetical protein [Bdellovibrionales bacterium]|tara:strand:- start:516 stop:1409 length:894 start_codon:yes stop_codon:yes gene_type:complete